MNPQTGAFRMREYSHNDIYIDENADTDHKTVLIVIANVFIRLTRPEADAVARKLSPDRRLIR